MLCCISKFLEGTVHENPSFVAAFVMLNWGLGALSIENWSIFGRERGLEGGNLRAYSKHDERFFFYQRHGFNAILTEITHGMSESRPDSEAGARRVFSTTHWSVVRAAGESDSEPAHRALETLCRGYWYPIYVYVRRKGHGPDEAQDLTQEFFTQLIAKENLRLADHEKGKFRTFLLAMLDHFLAREWRRAHRQKRGGQFTFISLDQETPEGRYQLESADNDTPEKRFLRQWAMNVVQQTMSALEAECEANGKGTLFRETRSFLSGERDGTAYGEIGQRLNMGEGAARMAVHRLRKRYGEMLRHEIAQTVSGPEEVDEEMRYLLTALSQ